MKKNSSSWSKPTPFSQIPVVGNATIWVKTKMVSMKAGDLAVAWRRPTSKSCSPHLAEVGVNSEGLVGRLRHSVLVALAEGEARIRMAFNSRFLRALWLSRVQDRIDSRVRSVRKVLLAIVLCLSTCVNDPN